MDYHSKYNHLKSILAEIGSALVAYSGGVDSTFLAKVAHDVLGKKMMAVTADSETYPQRELEEAKITARQFGFDHMVIETKELDDPEFCQNSSQRCYYCKRELVLKLWKIAKQKKLDNVLLANNLDDTLDFRPGIKAAEELDVREPLIEAKLTKAEVRLLSKELGLPTHDKPSMACLASRFPYGYPLTRTELKQVERAEGIIRDLGFKQVRVRHHGQLARIELEKEEITNFFEHQDMISNKFKDLGYLYVTVDMEGYQTGSLNKLLGDSDGYL
jgi:uncharacterized protein